MKVGIAGAGLVGRMMAWRLLAAGHQVTLFDRDDKTAEAAAGKVAAAMLAPYSEMVQCERQIFDWGVASVARWPQLLDQLHQLTGTAVSYQLRGSLVVAHGADRAYLDHFHRQLNGRLAAGEAASVARLNAAQIRELEPELTGRFSDALYLQQEGCLDNWGLLDQLAAAIVALGGEWHCGVGVESVEPHRLLVNGEYCMFDLAIDCRGVGARAQLDSLRGVRGEVLWVYAPEVALSRPVRLMHPRYQLYIAPKPGDVYVIGATEIESDSMAPITVRSSLELQSALYSVHKGFAEANVLRAYANCRPAFMNNLPRIDVADGYMSINGLYRHGYLLLPWVTDQALAALSGQRDSAMVFDGRVPKNQVAI